MAVTDFHYITRMSSGFKVYILEGQPHLRSEDRFRHMTSDRLRVIPAHPLKRKRSLEQGRTLEERREWTLSRSQFKAVSRQSGLNVLKSPITTWSPTASPTHIISSSVHCTPVMEEPLALIKKVHQDPEKIKVKTPTLSHIQARPSVITCVSSAKSVHGSKDGCIHSSVTMQQHQYNVEEHFQRSLGVNYQKCASSQLSISLSVDDHFAKALGEKWFELKASSYQCFSSSPSLSSSSSSSSSCSSPASSPIFSHSPGYGKNTK